MSGDSTETTTGDPAGLTEGVFYDLPAQFTSGVPTAAEIQAVGAYLATATPAYSFINTTDGFDYPLEQGVSIAQWLGADAAGRAASDTTPVDDVAFLATGYIYAPVAGIYTFAFTSGAAATDAASLTVDGGTVAEQDAAGTLPNDVDTAFLTQGYHSVSLLTWQATGGGLDLFAVGPGGAPIAYVTADTAEPTITGTVAGQTTTDAAGLKPFAHVFIDAADPAAVETVLLSVTDAGIVSDASGLLSGTGFTSGELSKTGSGTYTLTGSPLAVTQALQALVFTPTAHQVAPGQTVTTVITITADQSDTGPAGTLTGSGRDSTTSIVATALASPPTITGTLAGQTTANEAAIAPFAGVTISDVNVDASDTLTITLTGAGGTLSGAGLIAVAGGYQLTGPASVITGELQALSFTATTGPYQTPRTTDFTLADVSSEDATTASDSSTTVTDTNVSLASRISGAVAGQATFDETPVTPFAGVTIVDVNPAAQDSLAITLSGGDADGTLSGSVLTKTGAGAYTLAATNPAALTADLDALVFTPTAHQVAPGASVTTDFTLADSNSAGVTTTNATVSVVATAVATAPAIAGTVAGQSTTHEAAIRPFATASVSDVNAGASDTLTIAVSGEGGTLSGAGLVAVAGGYQLTGSASVITQELQALSFTANQGTPDTPSTTRFTLTDVSNEDPTPAIDATVSVTDTAPAVASKIGGLVAVQTTSDETSLKPFAGVTVTDPNGVPDSLAITLSGGDADGLLSGGGLSKTGAGSYALAATSAAALTAELDALVFTPTAHQVAPGASVTTQITLSDSNGAGFTTTAAASVIATASNDAPSIAGTVAGQTTQDNAAIAPFGSVTISDPDLGAADSLTISLIGADGSATDANGTLAGGGLVKTAAGTYVLAATNPAALTAELRALSFTPTEAEAAAGHTITTIFDLTATQNGLATVNSTTSVIVTPLDYIYGPIDGHATIEGSAGSDVITAFGWANTIYSNGGNDQIIAGQGTATVIGGAGNDQITLDGYYNVVTAGNGNDVVSGALGNTSISLGNGQDSVAVSGYYDTVALGNGQDTLTGPEGNATVTLGTGADTVTLGGDNNVVHAGSTTGTDFINAGTGSETVVGGNGTFVVLAGGDNDVITLGNGNDDVFTTPAGNPTLAPGSAVPVDAGAATVTTGSGNDTIILGGYGNTVNAGGGMNVIQGGTGNDLFFLPSAGQGFDRISGFTTENNDVLNLKSALAAAGWTGNSATLGSYLHVSDPATTAILSIAKGSGFTAVAQLQGVSGLTLATLQPHLTL